MDLGKPLLDVKTDTARVQIFRPANDVIVSVLEGYLTHELWLQQVPVYDAIYASSPNTHTFLDSLSVRSFDPRYRDASQAYIKGKEGQIADVVILQQSALVKLAIHAVSLFSGLRIQSETNRGAFEARLGAARAKPESNRRTARQAARFRASAALTATAGGAAPGSVARARAAAVPGPARGPSRRDGP
jgi:hypothetical protein